MFLVKENQDILEVYIRPWSYHLTSQNVFSFPFYSRITSWKVFNLIKESEFCKSFVPVHVNTMLVKRAYRRSFEKDQSSV